MLLKENIPVTYIFGKIWKEITFVTTYAVLIAVLYNNFHFTRISIPIAVPTILGTVISLLLAFKSNQAYDNNLLGIVSSNPAIVIGNSIRQGDNARSSPEGNVPVALSGRVPVKFSNENGEVKAGDYLTSSATKPGYAMKATKPGRVIGIVLTQLPTTDYQQPTVMVFINPHYAGQELDGNGQLAQFNSLMLQPASLWSNLYTYLQEKLAITMQQGLIKVAHVVAKFIETKKLKTQTLEARKSFTTKDVHTGEAYCITINSAQLQTKKGSCIVEDSLLGHH